MATYFDAQDWDDLQLLPTDVRDDDDLERVVDQVERDILATYRIRSGDTFYVMLYGYESTDPSAVKTQFADAMADAIALVTAHRIRNADAPDAIKSESRGRRSWSYKDNFNPKWPHGWQHPLTRFDLRSPSHAV